MKKAPEQAGGAEAREPCDRAGNAAAACVLIVDGSEQICDLVEILLCRVGYKVLKASGAADALRLARASQIDLCLCELDGRHFSGAELARQLAILKPDTPVIFLSWFAPWWEDNGRNAILGKPFSLQELRDCVQRGLRSSAASGRGATIALPASIPGAHTNGG
jgi:DNA-binding response OmpR family regulator